MTERRPSAALLLIALALAQAGCLNDHLIRCGERYFCPTGATCDLSGESPRCILPHMETACLDLEPGDSCINELDPTVPHVCVGTFCLPSRCGDDIADPAAGEICDGDLTCRDDCIGFIECGNGLLEGDEVCDDGNLDNQDSCTTRCAPPTCGDGLIRFGLEDCDDGGANSDTEPDACRTTCIPPACDDGVLDTGEAGDCWVEIGDIPATNEPVGVVVADLDHDGRADVIVGGDSSRTVEVFLSTAAGLPVAGPQSPHGTIADVREVQVAHLNGDDDLDVIATTRGHVRVFLGDGLGGLDYLVWGVPPDPDPYTVALGNLDGDAFIDIGAILGCSGLLYTGYGDGYFRDPVPVDLGFSNQACEEAELEVADMDGDGADDMVAAYRNDGWSIVKGDGTGGFTLVAGFPAAAPPGILRRLRVLDVDADQRPDLVFSVQSVPKAYVQVLLNQGGFQFVEAPGSPYSLGGGNGDIAFGDLDGDGSPDFATGDSFTPEIYVFLNTGTGSFDAVPSSPIATGLRVVSLGIGDLNGDGVNDLALGATEGELSVWMSLP